MRFFIETVYCDVVDAAQKCHYTIAYIHFAKIPKVFLSDKSLSGIPH